MSIDVNEILVLPVSERLRLVEAVWDSIAAEAASVPVPDWHREELDRRLNTTETKLIYGRPAAEVIEDLRKRK